MSECTQFLRGKVELYILLAYLLYRLFKFDTIVTDIVYADVLYTRAPAASQPCCDSSGTLGRHVHGNPRQQCWSQCGCKSNRV